MARFLGIVSSTSAHIAWLLLQYNGRCDAGSAPFKAAEEMWPIKQLPPMLLYRRQHRMKELVLQIVSLHKSLRRLRFIN